MATCMLLRQGTASACSLFLDTLVVLRFTLREEVDSQQLTVREREDRRLGLGEWRGKLAARKSGHDAPCPYVVQWQKVRTLAR